MMRDPFRVVAAAAVVGLGLVASTGCFRAWDDYDPEQSTGSSSAPVCGGVGVLTDDFDDDRIDERFWLDENGSAQIRDGQLVLSHPADDSSCSHFGSAYAYDLTGRSIGFELVSLPDIAENVAFRFWLWGESKHVLEITISNETVQFVTGAGEDLRTLASQRYDVSQHRFLRIREADGTVYWETSSDGSDWTQRAKETVANLFDVRFVSLELAGQTSGVITAPAEIRIDNLLGTGQATEDHCPCAALTDDFEDGVTSAAWDSPAEHEHCSMVETGGELVVTAAAETYNRCYYRSVAAYDLRGSSLSVELTSAPDPAVEGFFALRFEADAEHYFHSEVKGGTLYCTQVTPDGCTELASSQYSPSDHRWLRFREEAGTVYFETSADGVSWRTETSSIDPFQVDMVRVGVEAGTYGEPTAPVEVRLDNLNVVPR